jgi:hypothetical protein
MMEGRVPGDNAQRHGVVQDEVGEESSVLVASRGCPNESESVLREVDPEQFGSQRMVLRMLGGGLTRARKSITNRVDRVLAH